MMNDRERIEREKELKRERKFLRNIMATMPDSLVILDKELRIRGTNRSFHDLFGTEPEMAIGRKLSDILADGRLSAELTKLFGTEDRLENFELRYQSEELGERVLSLTGVGVIVAEEEEEEEEEEEQLLVLIKDITEQSQMQETLKESEARYRALVQLGAEVGEAIVLLGNTELGEGTHLFFSDEWLRITGYQQEELQRMSFFDLLSPGDRADFIARYRRRLSGESIPGLYEMTVIRKDGTQVPVEFTGAFTTHQGERVVVAYIRDISERKETETRLLSLTTKVIEEQERWRLVVNSVADGIYVTDKDLRVLVWNPSAERITGWKAPEVIGRRCADFLSHEDENGSRLCDTPGCPLTQALTTGEPVMVSRAAGHRADGRLVPLSVSAAPVKDSNGGILGIVEVFRDISREMEIDRMKSDFVSTVSHELRTPLTAIMGFVELLLIRDPPEHTRRQWLEVIQTESRRLAALIDDLLDLSRIESRRISLQLEPLDLAEVVSARFEALEPSLDKHRLKQALPPRLPRVNADRLRLERILDNLLSNAIKYSPGGGEVTVSACREGDYVRVSVSDQGVGIPADKLDKLFQRFQQLEPFTRRRWSGVGLGLSISKASVELQGGRIWAESEVGKGSTFHFTLPIAQDERSDTKNDSVSRTKGQKKDTGGR
jgi:PAS domain S-box-containing protein